MKKRLISILSLALAFTLVACGGGTKTQAPKDGAETASAGGEQVHNTWYIEEPTTLNSAQGSDVSSYSLLLNIMEPLVRSVESEDGKVTIEPAGAESWETSEDGLTWTFKIREGNTWTNGDPVTAKDYAFGIQTALDPERGAGGMGWMLDTIEGYAETVAGTKSGYETGVKAVDDYTLEIKLSRPTSYFIQLAATRPMLPIHQAKYEENAQNYGAELNTIEQCGPFTMTDWTHQTEVKLVKNENYWDKDKVNLSKVSWRIMTDETTRYNAFLNGEIDGVNTDKKEWEDKFNAMGNVINKKFASPSLTYLFFNTEVKPFNNPKVRLAISAAFDRQEFVDSILNGVGFPAYGWVTPAITTAEGVEYRQAVPAQLEKIIKEVGDPKALLEEGLKEEGMTIEQFQPRFDIGGTSASMREWGDYYINVFQTKLGVNINLSLNEWSAFSDQVQQGNYEIGQMAWFADYNDPYTMLSLLQSETDGIMTKWKNPEYDKLVEEAVNEKDPQKQLDLYSQAEEIALREAPVLPIFFTQVNNFRYDYVKGLAYNNFATQGLKYVDTSARP